MSHSDQSGELVVLYIRPSLRDCRDTVTESISLVAVAQKATSAVQCCAASEAGNFNRNKSEVITHSPLTTDN